ncbi:uncharacterized protein I303_107054 [Kwoniella dejecticola CBS 10117]|uniref:Uncharacterized protein n=1 Tax=Kwoniella dejecticola CBS 10117 TaxID=1296121 RepID=A0A1A5ZYM2_9TREE|nr:uncharacterized protein I303_06455 [Kwoniella dejecticola CBS 10117]OBR82898.1 hypothetical protein I303_06455 [Kwoniella dejecticola CBS 10117]
MSDYKSADFESAKTIKANNRDVVPSGDLSFALSNIRKEQGSDVYTFTVDSVSPLNAEDTSAAEDAQALSEWMAGRDFSARSSNIYISNYKRCEGPNRYFSSIGDFYGQIDDLVKKGEDRGTVTGFVQSWTHNLYTPASFAGSEQVTLHARANHLRPDSIILDSVELHPRSDCNMKVLQRNVNFLNDSLCGKSWVVGETLNADTRGYALERSDILGAEEQFVERFKHGTRYDLEVDENIKTAPESLVGLERAGPPVQTTLTGQLTWTLRDILWGQGQ